MMEQMLTSTGRQRHQQQRIKVELHDATGMSENVVGGDAHADYVDFHEIFGGRQLGGDKFNQMPDDSLLDVYGRPVFANHHQHQPSVGSTYSSSESSASVSSAFELAATPMLTMPMPTPATASSDSSSGGGGGKLKRFPCPECGKLFGRVSHVRRHQLLHSGDKPFECDVCGDRFTRLENRDRHMIMHTKVRPYNCETCSKGFTQLNRLKVHRLTHTGERPFTCAMCAKRFLRVDHLRVHMRTHRGEVVGNGAVSGDRGDEKKSLKRASARLAEHKPPQIAHFEEDLPCEVELRTEVAVPVEERIPIADQPKPTPKLPLSLPKRAAIVDGVYKPFQCAECSKQFFRRDHYARHVATHSGARPFECDLCTKTFSRKDNKYSHMVGCLLKNYGITVDCGGGGNGGEMPRGTLQRKVDERVREALGDSYIEPVTQLQEFEDGDDDDHDDDDDAYDDGDGDDADDDADDDVDGETSSGDNEDEDPALLHPREIKEEAFLTIVDCHTNEHFDIVELPDEQQPLTSPSPPPQSRLPSPNTVGYLKVRDLSEIAIIPMLNAAEQQPPHVGHNVDEVDDDNDDENDGGDGGIADEQPENYALVETLAATAAQRVAAAAFRCDVCDKAFQHKSHLVRHAALHTADRPFRCDQCDKAFSRKEHLQRHVIVHTGIKPFRCTFCDRRFVEQHQQRRHIVDEHAAEAAAAAAEAGEEGGSECVMDSGEAQLGADGLYHCDRCDLAYPAKCRLRRHYAQHTGDKPHQCDYCEQRFSRTEHKRRHMAIHTNEKRYECEFCERRFIRADHMLAHVKTHEGVLPYKCTVCAHRFATAKEKKEHQRRHTGAYRCEMCLERFESFADLSEHRRDIHLQAETQRAEILVGRQEHYPCPVCKKYFSIVRLGDHLKSHVADDGPAANGGGGRGDRQRPVYADGMAVCGGGGDAYDDGPAADGEHVHGQTGGGGSDVRLWSSPVKCELDAEDVGGLVGAATAAIGQC